MAAMYDNMGFCPNNEFLLYARENFVPDIWERTHDILGDRTDYMVYTGWDHFYDGWCYVVDCLMGAETTIEVEIACTLKTMIPQCKHAETGRKILVTDVINPFKIPHVGCNYPNDGTKRFASTDSSMHIFEDERYVCGVIDEGESVHMYFFKK